LGFVIFYKVPMEKHGKLGVMHGTWKFKTITNRIYLSYNFEWIQSLIIQLSYWSFCLYISSLNLCLIPNVKIVMYLLIAIRVVFVAILSFIKLKCKFIMDSYKMCCQVFRCRTSHIFYLKWICSRIMTIVGEEWSLLC
jgi:hypothetical protein